MGRDRAGGSGWWPPGRDLAVAAGFCAVSLAQVLVDPITTSRGTSVLVALTATLPLAWRRRYPAVAALTGTAVWLVPTSGYLFLGYVVWVLLYYSVGHEVPSLRRMAAVTSAGVILGVTAAALSPQPLPVAAGSALAVAAPAIGGRLAARHRAQAARLQELTEQLVRERATAERAAVAEERTRIAREVHDVVGHQLSVIALQADAAAAALAKAPERAAAPVAAIRSATGEALAEMRRALGLLRADDPQQALRPQPGLDDLPALVDQSRAAGTRVDLALRPPHRDVPASVQLAAYRVVQEGLTNARRHAPGAAVRVCVDGGEDGILVSVSDSGGTPAPAGRGTGLGLVGMRERVRTLGGDLEVGPAPDGGYVLTARLPLDAPTVP